MCMIELCSWIVCLELVAEGSREWYGTLGKIGNPIHVRGISLMDTVPVYSSCRAIGSVVHIYHDNITFAYVNLWTWYLAINAHDSFFQPITHYALGMIAILLNPLATLATCTTSNHQHRNS